MKFRISPIYKRKVSVRNFCFGEIYVNVVVIVVVVVVGGGGGGGGGIYGIIIVGGRVVNKRLVVVLFNGIDGGRNTESHISN